VKFTVDGGVEWQRNAASPWVAKAIAVLDKLPAGQLLSTRGLVAKTGASRNLVAHEASDPLLEGYRIKTYQRRVYYGNTETIKLARKEFGT
jgi:hypothetical protein